MEILSKMQKGLTGILPQPFGGNGLRHQPTNPASWMRATDLATERKSLTEGHRRLRTGGVVETYPAGLAVAHLDKLSLSQHCLSSPLTIRCDCFTESEAEATRRNGVNDQFAHNRLPLGPPFLPTAMACSDDRALGCVPAHGSDCGTLCRTARFRVGGFFWRSCVAAGGGAGLGVAFALVIGGLSPSSRRVLLRSLNISYGLF